MRKKMVYKFCVINHKTLEDRGMLERNQILERRRSVLRCVVPLSGMLRRGKELEGVGPRVGSSTSLTASIASVVRSNKGPGLTRSERRVGESLRTIRRKYQVRRAYFRWRRAVLRLETSNRLTILSPVTFRTKQVVLTDGDRKLKFFLSLWNFKVVTR